jgi:hypothetical protein
MIEQPLCQYLAILSFLPKVLITKDVSFHKTLFFDGAFFINGMASMVSSPYIYGVKSIIIKKSFLSKLNFHRKGTKGAEKQFFPLPPRGGQGERSLPKLSNRS